MEAEELRIGIKNIEDRAYSMMYYNQKLRSAKDCRRISIAKDNDIIRLMEQYAKEQAVDSDKLAQHFFDWLKLQKYSDENILHVAICCDHVGMMRFIKAISNQIDQFKQQP